VNVDPYSSFYCGVAHYRSKEEIVAFLKQDLTSSNDLVLYWTGRAVHFGLALGVSLLAVVSEIIILSLHLLFLGEVFLTGEHKNNTYSGSIIGACSAIFYALNYFLFVPAMTHVAQDLRLIEKDFTYLAPEGDLDLLELYKAIPVTTLLFGNTIFNDKP